MKCPHCQNEFSMLEKCKEIDCNKFICAVCSIDGLCIDCFIKFNRIIVIDDYYGEKYSCGI